MNTSNSFQTTVATADVLDTLPAKPRGAPGIKKVRARRKVKNRMASLNRRRNRK